MLDRDPARLHVDRERALAAVVDLKPSRKELVHASFQLLDQRRGNRLSVYTLAGCVTVLKPVDRSRVAVSRLGGFYVGDPVLHESRQDFSPEFGLGLL